MKKRALRVLGVFAAIVIVALIAMAQSPSGGSVSVSNKVSCPAPSPGVFAVCEQALGGAVWTDNGSPYAPWTMGGAQAVASVFGRTGVIVPQTGDYQFPQIGGQLSASQLPSTTTCSFTSNVSLTGATITLNACH